MSTRTSASGLLGSIAVLTAALVAPVDASGQVTDRYPSCGEQGLSIDGGPTLVSNAETTIGFDALAIGCWAKNVRGSDVDRRFPKSWVFRVGADGTYAPTGSAMPRASSLSIAGGYGISLVLPGVPSSDTTFDIDALPPADRSYGWIEIVGDFTYEASSDWQEQNALLGGQLRYGVRNPGWWRAMPSLIAHVEGVIPTGTQNRDLVASPSAHWRWGGQAYWNTALDFVHPAIERLRFTADLALYRTSGLEAALEAAGWHQGEYARLGLGYVPPPTSWISAFYVRYTNGRWPTAPTDADGLSVGLGVRLKRR